MTDRNPTDSRELVYQVTDLQAYRTRFYKHLARIHRFLQPNTYVEIGVGDGSTLRLAQPETRCIGIDPNPPGQLATTTACTIFGMTSDEFFDRHNLYAELGDRPVELALIDGMHLFENALRDFINLEQYCAAGAVILIHDCWPVDSLVCSRVRRTNVWAGDVWKLPECLERYRPDIVIRRFTVRPTGLALVGCLDPGSKHLASWLPQIYAEYVPLDFAGTHKHVARWELDEWPSIRTALIELRRSE